MALIQINQKLLHITITLLIYGVRIESVKCPESCHCVETSVFYNVNSTKTDFDILDVSDKTNFERLDINKTSLKSGEVTADKKKSLNVNVTRWEEIGDANNKTSKKNLKDIFIRNFSTENPLIKNSKEIRIKRTLKLNVNDTFSNSKRLKVEASAENSLGAGKSTTTPSVTSSPNSKRLKAEASAENSLGARKSTTTPSVTSSPLPSPTTTVTPPPPISEKMENSGTGGNEKRVKEIFTYQITCNEVRDLKSLWFQDLPNPTTQLIIQEAYFQSVKTFHQILKETSTKLNQLTDLSVTNSIINQKPVTEADDSDSAPSVQKRREFLPFASLQNPILRAKPDHVIEYGKSKNLLILNLSNNSLNYLPKDSFDRFPNLQTLDLSNNLIEKLDDEIFNPLINLLRLDIHNNKIKSLNEVIFKNLTKLLTLDVSSNLISNVAPSTFQYLTSLNTLIIADNPLSTKQEAMLLLGTGKRLQIVDASKTGLKQIPGTLERSVRTLNLKGNYLSSIQCGDLDSYSLLTYLDLRDNKISYVEDDALGRLELLNNLQINQNNLFAIPKSLPNNLEILNLSYNNIQNITNSDFLNLSLLKELSLSYNQVSNIEENSFDNLIQLKFLDLSHNPILILPNMYGLVKLTILNLSYFTNIPNNFNSKLEEFPAQSPENIRILNLESSPILTKIFLQDTKTLQSFVNLRELYMRFSNLTSLRKDLFSLLPKLQLLKIEGNPWHCEKDILKVSDWLKSHEKMKQMNEDEEENEINTAHCATPNKLHKKPLITLNVRDFEDRSLEIEKVNTKNIFKNQMTVKKVQEIQSKDRIYLKSFQKAIDYNKEEEEDKKIEETSNAKIDFNTEGNKKGIPQKSKIKKDKEIDSNVKLLLNYNKTENKRVISEGNSSLQESSSTSDPHFTADKSDPEKNESQTETQATLNEADTTAITTLVAEASTTKSSAVAHKTASTTSIATKTTTSVFLNTTSESTWKEENWTESSETLNTFKNWSENELNELNTVSYSEVKEGESFLVKETLSSEKQENSHPGFFVLSFVGVIMIATLTVSFIHFAKTKRDRNYQRQNQDIEVRSISSLGNELW